MFSCFLAIRTFRGGISHHGKPAIETSSDEEYTESAKFTNISVKVANTTPPMKNFAPGIGESNTSAASVKNIALQVVKLPQHL